MAKRHHARKTATPKVLAFGRWLFAELGDRPFKVGYAQCYPGFADALPERQPGLKTGPIRHWTEPYTYMRVLVANGYAKVVTKASGPKPTVWRLIPERFRAETNQ